MSCKHHVVITPGISGEIRGLKFATKNWQKRYGIYPEVIQTVWKDEIGLEPKLKKVTDLIDSLVEKGHKVSLIGTSAGGSLMMNAFVDRVGVVEKAINVCGFLRPGTEEGYRSLEERSAESIAFRESVLRFEKLENKLTAEDRKKILTVRPLWDELVPGKTVTVDGALNIQIPTIEHVFSIATAMVLYDPVVKFLKTSE
jgi:hypothetical protein